MHSKVDQELGAQLGNLDGAFKRARASQPRARLFKRQHCRDSRAKESLHIVLDHGGSSSLLPCSIALAQQLLAKPSTANTNKTLNSSISRSMVNKFPSQSEIAYPPYLDLCYYWTLHALLLHHAVPLVTLHIYSRKYINMPLEPHIYA